jgi:Zn-dependent peptidase ImmA (M78 family)
MPSRSRDQLEATARSMRQQLGIDDQRQPDMMTVIIKLKHKGVIRNYVRTIGALPPNRTAEFDPATGLLTLEETEFCAINRGNPRGRFTAAHEAAHAWLGHTHARYRSMPGELDHVSLAPVRKDEFEANYVAAAFLMPPHLLPRDPGEMLPPEIADFFNVSRTAAEIRKPELERLWRRARGIERPLPDAVVRFLEGRKT